MNRLFIDANVLMEIMFDRTKRDKCTKLLSQLDTVYFVSTLSAHILYYYGEKARLDTQDIGTIVSLGKLLPLDSSTVRIAQDRYTGRDFEDCLQAACAELGGCTEILTLDKNFKKHSGTRLKVTLG